jgi:hemin uptake protein HemP
MFENPSRDPRASANANPSDEGAARQRDPLRIDSRNLLAGGREFLIDHAGQAYRLRLTRNDKLILTK